MFIGCDQDGFPGTTVVLTGDSLADNRQDARDSLEFLDNFPVTNQVLKSDIFVECEVKDLLKRFGYLLYSRDRRYEVDNRMFS